VALEVAELRDGTKVRPPILKNEQRLISGAIDLCCPIQRIGAGVIAATPRRNLEWRAMQCYDDAYDSCRNPDGQPKRRTGRDSDGYDTSPRSGEHNPSDCLAKCRPGILSHRPSLTIYISHAHSRPSHSRTYTQYTSRSASESYPPEGMSFRSAEDPATGISPDRGRGRMALIPHARRRPWSSRSKFGTLAMRFGGGVVHGGAHAQHQTRHRPPQCRSRQERIVSAVAHAVLGDPSMSVLSGGARRRCRQMNANATTSGQNASAPARSRSLRPTT